MVPMVPMALDKRPRRRCSTTRLTARTSSTDSRRIRRRARGRRLRPRRRPPEGDGALPRRCHGGRPPALCGIPARLLFKPAALGCSWLLLAARLLFKLWFKRGTPPAVCSRLHAADAAAGSGGGHGGGGGGGGGPTRRCGTRRRGPRRRGRASRDPKAYYTPCSPPLLPPSLPPSPTRTVGRLAPRLVQAPQTPHL